MKGSWTTARANHWLRCTSLLWLLPGLAAPANIRAATVQASDAALVAHSASAPDGSFRGRHHRPTISEDELIHLRRLGAPCNPSVYQWVWSIAGESMVSPTVVSAMIEVESSCNRRAASVDGAQGLMQLVPASGARVGYQVVYGVDSVPSRAELYDARFNIRLGVAYLQHLVDHFAYVRSDDARLLLAVASFNCGPDFVDRRLPADAAEWGFADAGQWISHHAPLQTRRYVIKVMDRSARYTAALNGEADVGQGGWISSPVEAAE